MSQVMRKTVVLALLGWAAGVLPGCMFRELSQNQRELDTAAAVTVYIDSDRFGDHPVYVGLVDDMSDDDMMGVTVETWGVAPQRGGVELKSVPGHYLVVAFQDLNQNRRFDDGEPFARHGEPTAINLWPGRMINELRLSLQMSVLPDMWTPRGLQDLGVEFSDRLEGFGRQVKLDDPMFERDVARMGMWRPAEFIRGNYAGLYVLEPYTPQKTPVVFIHGIGGSPRHFETIIARMDRERFQPWVFYYPSAVRIQEAGDYLQVALERMKARHRYDRVFVVAHSMGGLVAWAGVRKHLEQTVTPYVDLLVTIHSPLGGMASAATGVDRAPVVMESWIDLDPRSDFVEAVYRGSVPTSMPYHLFYGVAEDQEVDRRLPIDRNQLDIELTAWDPEALNDETVSLGSQLHRPAVAQAAAIHGHRATHMGTLRDPETIVTLNRILAERAVGLAE